MSKHRIAFFDTKPYDRESFDEANRAQGFDITYLKPHLNTSTMALAKGFDAICVFVNDKISSDVVDHLYQNGTRLIALRCAGYNNIDLKSVFGRIHVVRVPEYSPHAVAEHTLALILSLNRKIHRAYSRTRDNNFSINGLLGFDLYGKTAGIVGTGRIGRIVASILKGFGMEVVAYDPYPDTRLADSLGYHHVDLEELYHRADVISLHCPLTPNNAHMINRRSISQMKPGVMLINTGRGKLIDTKALIGGLKSRRIGAAGLDVYEEETEYFFEDLSDSVLTDDVLARLLTFPNVLVTSHQGFFTKEAITSIAETTLNNIERFLLDDELPNEICYKCSEGECKRKELGRCF